MKTTEQAIKQISNVYVVPKDAKRVPFAPSYYVTRDGKTVYSFRVLRALCQTLNSSDPKKAYYYVCFVDGEGKTRRMPVHRLVALTWIPNPKGLPVVGHKDDDKLNNHVDNLYWTTYKGNTSDAITSRRMPWQQEGWIPPMTGRSHGEKTKSLMSKKKMGSNHPKFKGYYYYEGKRFGSYQEIADYLGTYTMKVMRMFKKGLVTRGNLITQPNV